jgi:C4-type Zn-finger protein
MTERMKCEVCGLNYAAYKDYRTDPYTGDIAKHYVCANCFFLADFWYWKLLESKDKKRAVREITGKGWKSWIISALTGAEA